MATTLALASGAFFAAALIAARFLPWQPTFTAGVLAGGGDGLVPWLLEQPRRVAPQDVEAIRQIVSQLPAADLVRAPRDAN